MVPLFLLLLTSQVLADEPSCDSKIFCQGPLLHTVQMAQIFPSSKTFVNMKLKTDEPTTLANFDTLLKDTDNKPTEDHIKKFVEENFEPGDELEDFTPTDFTATPQILERIEDADNKGFAKDLVGMWPQLVKKVKQDVFSNPAKYTLIPVENAFVIPGGQLHNWGSYWIIRGLILSDMFATAGGMIDDYLKVVDKYGFLPNGARIYYLNRSQPPLLTLMVAAYFEATNDVAWLKNAIPILEKEIKFWMTHRTVKVKKNDVEYTLFLYNVDSGSPRPESYYEDFTIASAITDEDAKKVLYADIKSAAESGWEFSSRWFFDDKGGNNNSLSSIETKRVIPVDLNSYLAQAFAQLSSFYDIIKDEKNSKMWNEKALLWQEVIEKVFWSNEDGTWYDWDSELSQPRKYFYPSNFAPLFAKAYDPRSGEYLGQRAADYIDKQKVLDYKGGVPTSFINSGEQWDLPNAWPPLQSLVAFGLEYTGHEKAKAIAKELALRTITAFKLGFKKSKQMFEKYDANTPGEFGGGGEPTVQSGFGWTNGVGLEFLDRFFSKEKDTATNKAPATDPKAKGGKS